MLPKDYTPVSNGDALDGVYWICECNSTLLTPHENIDTTTEACDCPQCEDSESPCFYLGDCNLAGDLCMGCLEQEQVNADREFDERSSMGYL